MVKQWSQTPLRSVTYTTGKCSNNTTEPPECQHNPSNSQERNFSWIYCWELRGGIPTLQGRGGIEKRIKENENEFVSMKRRRGRSKWANERPKVHVGECFSAGKIISLQHSLHHRGLYTASRYTPLIQNTLPPPTSTLPTSSCLLLAFCTVCCRVLGAREAARKPDNQAAVTSGPH